jgi:hypothetical protein
VPPQDAHRGARVVKALTTEWRVRSIEIRPRKAHAVEPRTLKMRASQPYSLEARMIEIRLA